MIECGYSSIVMSTQPYDLIGDIHGHHEKLISLLARLGYKATNSTFRHAEGRKVIFLGDYIDRGPAIRETLHTVRGMVEAGDALAIMGNHEYNAICAETPDGKGNFLRPEKKNREGQRVTKQQFAGRDAEWEEWKEWLKHLPMFLDLGSLRVVHACWDAPSIARMAGHSIVDPEYLRLTATSGTPEARAVYNVLKGPELDMPANHIFTDKEGITRHNVRVRWWDIPQNARVSHLAMPTPFDVPGDAAPHDLRRIPNYAADEPPVFFGHYWLPPDHPRMPLAPNIACLDYSAARDDNPLTAYRWDGEQVLSAEKYVTSSH